MDIESTGLREVLSSYPEPHPSIDLSGVIDTAEQLRFKKESIDRLSRTVTAIEASDQLTQLAAALDQQLSQSPADLPVPGRDDDEPTRLIWAPVLLQRAHEVFQRQAELGIPKEDTTLLLQDIERWMEEYHRRHGIWGLEEINWLRLHFSDRLFQFGRLQFEPGRFEWPYNIYSHIRTGALVALLEDGTPYRRDGQLPDADVDSYFPPDSPDPPNLTVTTARLHKDHTFVQGIPVHPRRGITGETITIDTRKWHRIAGPGSSSVAVHIPAMGPLLPEEVSQSLSRASSFFADSAEDAPALFTCDSWLMDPALLRCVPQSGNIARFQRLFSTVPVPEATDHQHFERIFPAIAPVPGDIDEIHPHSSLQKILISHIKSGGVWRLSGGIRSGIVRQ